MDTPVRSAALATAKELNCRSTINGTAAWIALSIDRRLRSSGNLGESVDSRHRRTVRYNVQEHSADLDSLGTRVCITLVHELGHYIGLDDARLQELGGA